MAKIYVFVEDIAKASGRPDSAIADCIEAVLGTMMPKIIGAMKKGAR